MYNLFNYVEKNIRLGIRMKEPAVSTTNRRRVIIIGAGLVAEYELVKKIWSLRSPFWRLQRM